ncbi:MAG TPA: DUF4432 domain-containing protein, partial [Acetobacteraceae bacterium]|nr:DUF4432 domain-containing protein [Acetobacteraceae bacterium]
MYMAHAIFGFPGCARILQPAPWTPEHVRVRSAVPRHVRPTPDYERLLERLARDPAALQRLDDPALLATEQVFYLSGLRPNPDGRIEVLLRRQEGDAFGISWREG